MSKKRRGPGRPKGSGYKKDLRVLEGVAEALTRDPGLSIKAAIRSCGYDEPNDIRRIERHFSQDKVRLMGEAERRLRPCRSVMPEVSDTHFAHLQDILGFNRRIAEFYKPSPWQLSMAKLIADANRPANAFVQMFRMLNRPPENSGLLALSKRISEQAAQAHAFAGVWNGPLKKD